MVLLCLKKPKKINVWQKNAMEKICLTLYIHIPVVYGIWHLFYQLPFVLQLMGHALYMLLVILISILKEMVTDWEMENPVNWNPYYCAALKIPPTHYSVVFSRVAPHLWSLCLTSWQSRQVSRSQVSQNSFSSSCLWMPQNTGFWVDHPWISAKRFSI